jgi:hypothetical protein
VHLLQGAREAKAKKAARVVVPAKARAAAAWTVERWAAKRGAMDVVEPGVGKVEVAERRAARRVARKVVGPGVRKEEVVTKAMGTAVGLVAARVVVPAKVRAGAV